MQLSSTQLMMFFSLGTCMSVVGRDVAPMLWWIFEGKLGPAIAWRSCRDDH
jgi:hypothetical protein